MITLTLNNTTYVKEIVGCLMNINEPITLRNTKSKDMQTARQLLEGLIPPPKTK